MEGSENLNTLNASPPNSRNLWIDVIRGIAIIGVVSVHTEQATHVLLKATSETWFSGWVSQGMYGVELFFFISGWLISAIYKKPNEFKRSRFFQKRAGRILPLWLLFFLLIFLRGVFFPNNPGSWGSAQNFIDAHQSGGFWLVILMVLTFSLWISNELWNSLIPGSWSIQVEVAHYLFYPILKNNSRVFILLTLTSISLLTLWMAYFRPDMPQAMDELITAWIRLNLYSTMFYFLVGVVAQNIYSSLKVGKSPGSVVAETPFTEISLIAIYAVSTLSLPLAFGSNLPALGFIFIALFVGYAITRARSIAPMFRIAGKYSYFMYFAHFGALEFLLWIFTTYFELNFTSWPLSEIPIFIVLFCLVWGLCLPIAWLSWKFFEKPISRKIEFGRYS